MLDNLTGSGSATNAGIDYQQRVSAWFLISLLMDRDISEDLDLSDSLKIKEIAFETAKNIDDLKITLNNQSVIYLQIKRTLSLSKSSGSEFYKTIEQFIKEYLSNKRSRDYYLLATSTESSSKILRELRKILESIRLNDERFTQNPLNKSELDTFEKYYQVALEIFKNQSNRDMSWEEFREFSKRVYISPFDIEQDMPLEKAAIILLSQESAISPRLLWALLIKNSLYYATERLSLNKEGLKRKLGRYLSDVLLVQPDKKLSDEEIIEIFMDEEKTSSGKEVLLIKSFPTESDLLIAELFRFNEDCSKRLEFFDDKCLVIESGMTWTIIFRASTNVGMKRLLDENPDIFEWAKRMIHAPANDIDNVEETICAKAYSEFIHKSWKSHENFLRCLHCGKAISEKTNYQIEIDCRNSESAVGCVHKDCLKPVDRVLGTLKNEFFDHYDFLKKFDVTTWSRLIKNGQGLFNSFTSRDYKYNTRHIGWSSDFEYDANYNYCIRLNLEDSSCEYIYQRGKVVRLKEAEAKEKAEFMNITLKEARKEKNPFCITTKKKTFGLYNLISAEKDENEAILECLSAEPVRYSRAIEKIYARYNDFYAPLCMILDAQTEETFTINDHVVFITDPLVLKEFLENWKRAQIELTEYEMKIIESDRDFDIKMRYIFSNDLKAIVNPQVDRNRNFIRGISIIDFNETIRSLEKNRQ